MKQVAVILAGGRGERFWPKSTRARPKQFLSLFDKKAMVVLTRQRLSGLVRPRDQYYVVPRDLARAARRVLPGGRFIIEPAGRNTAAAIGLAAMSLEARFGDAVMFVLPSDHLIRDRKAFQRGLRAAAALALKGYLVTFGIRPTRAETGYGYIKCRRRLGAGHGVRSYSVAAFKEKPDPRTARRYVRAGNYLWNSGIFVWKASAILAALRKHAPGLHRGLVNYARTKKRGVFESLPSLSVDYQVMEKARRIALVEAGFDWDDVGAWDALARHYPKDAGGNVAVGRTMALGARNSIIFADKMLIAAIGVEDLVIVEGPTAVLVCSRSHLGKVREVARRAKNR